MSVKKLAAIIGGLVIITLIILFVINTVVPGAVDYGFCAIGTFAGGGGSGTTLQTCADNHLNVTWGS